MKRSLSEPLYSPADDSRPAVHQSGCYDLRGFATSATLQRAARRQHLSLRSTSRLLCCAFPESESEDEVDEGLDLASTTEGTRTDSSSMSTQDDGGHGYGSEIQSYLRTLEQQLHVSSSLCVEHQFQVNWRMRGILIDWLSEVSFEQGLSAETRHLAVSYLDSYLACDQHVLPLSGKVTLK